MPHDLPDDLPDRLAQRLRETPPDPVAQRRFAPDLGYGRHWGPAPGSARQAAVLAPLYRHEGRWTIPLMLRPEHMLDHASQISLPGGAVEAGETRLQCAVREFEEELGVSSPELRVLGSLSSLYVFASNFCVTPYLGLLPARPDFHPSPREVALLLEAPLDRLLDREAWGEHWIERRGIRFRAPHIDVQGHRVWGATCMMLGELIEFVTEVDA